MSPKAHDDGRPALAIGIMPDGDAAAGHDDDELAQHEADEDAAAHHLIQSVHAKDVAGVKAAMAALVACYSSPEEEEEGHEPEDEGEEYGDMPLGLKKRKGGEALY